MAFDDIKKEIENKENLVEKKEEEENFRNIKIFIDKVVNGNKTLEYNEFLNIDNFKLAKERKYIDDCIFLIDESGLFNKLNIIFKKNEKYYLIKYDFINGSLKNIWLSKEITKEEVKKLIKKYNEI